MSTNDGIPRSEHPNPQFMRSEWLNLNGCWEFAETDEDESSRFLSDTPYPEKIMVPFCRESKLSGIGRTKPVKNVWYRRTFTKPRDWKSERMILHIGACDWKTDVWVNGQKAGEHTGGSVSFSFDISRFLHPDSNTLIVHAFDNPSSGIQALGKQSPDGVSHGCIYTGTTGIWQTVWLEGVGISSIQSFVIDPQPKSKMVLIDARIDGSIEDLKLYGAIFKEGNKIGYSEIPVQTQNNVLVIDLKKFRLWSPSDPFLYDLTLGLIRNGEPVDMVQSYFGVRTVAIQGACYLINDEPIFQRTVLDQGFYPDGVWTAPSEDALKKDIMLSMNCGFNGARLHQKVFEPRFHYWADKLGYLTWGEYPNWGLHYTNREINKPVIDEWVEILARDRNHPSIIGWCPFNETPPEAGNIQSSIFHITKAIDPSRPVIESSGYAHTIPDPEVLDAHDYNQNPDSFRKMYESRWLCLPERYGISQFTGVPFFLSEYGGIGWDIQNKGWGYGNQPENLEAFHKRFEGLAWALMDNRYIFGLCYTQLTDVEQEQNGLYYYDRGMKFDVERFKKVLKRKAAYEKNPPYVVNLKQREWEVLTGA
ncbi:beta-glucuronidase, partial [Candidatus Sumerlaeota bacterium]|nr:beta-glucuronidase [Candidatus Sumerlaeota bacterium]